MRNDNSNTSGYIIAGTTADGTLVITGPNGKRYLAPLVGEIGPDGRVTFTDQISARLAPVAEKVRVTMDSLRDLRSQN